MIFSENEDCWIIILISISNLLYPDYFTSIKHFMVKLWRILEGIAGYAEDLYFWGFALLNAVSL